MNHEPKSELGCELLLGKGQWGELGVERSHIEERAALIGTSTMDLEVGKHAA